MVCPYCGNRVIVCGYIICATCKYAKTWLEFQIACDAVNTEEVTDEATK